MQDRIDEIDRQQHAAGDPAEAFDALREKVEDLGGDLTREMTTIRKGVEAAFDAMEKVQPSTDYGPELGRMVQQLEAVETRMAAIEKAPALRQGPHHHTDVIENAVGRATTDATRAIEARARELDRVSADIGRSLVSARLRRLQNRWLGGAGAAGLVVGVLLTLFLPRVLPFSAEMHVASIVVGESPWQAGARLMRYGSPASWQTLALAYDLVVANMKSIDACRAAAARTGKKERCSILVEPPGK